ncbi:MAG: thermonuclease family protein [Rhodospirillaceae bacterium]
MRQVFLLIGGLLVLAGSAQAAFGSDAVTGAARVIDGDTLAIQGVRVRLWAVDAPEIDQTCRSAAGLTWPCGLAAAEVLKERLRGQFVTCWRRDTDRYGRMVATCTVGTTDVGAWLLINGWAVTYWREVPAYSDLEHMAKSNKAGIWSSRFAAPSEWRRAQK